MQNPKISIIIPLYNQYKKLLKCLESIKNQTFQDFEIIIVNDGSTDITPDKLDVILERAPHLRGEAIESSNFDKDPIAPPRRDSRMTVNVIHQENCGAPSARNRGFAESKGQYVIFCDADIEMEKTMLEKMNKVLDENPKISYVYCSFVFGWKKFKLWEFDPVRLQQMPYIHTTSLIRRECFVGFDENLKRLQDWDLYLTMLEKGYIGGWIQEYLFRVKGGGKISSWIPSFFAKRSIGQKAKEYQRALEIVRSKYIKKS